MSPNKFNSKKQNQKVIKDEKKERKKILLFRVNSDLFLDHFPFLRQSLILLNLPLDTLT